MIEPVLLVNIAVTGLCLYAMGLYFNYREKKMHAFAEKKLSEFRDRYAHDLSRRKVKERQEINKLKEIVEELEKKHREAMTKGGKSNNHTPESQEIIKQAEERGKQIEASVKEEARRFLEEQKQDVQTKMVDLVMSVTRKVLAKSLTYEEHKELIEQAMLEVEGEVTNDKRS